MDEQKTTIQKPDAAVADYSNEINAMYDAQRQQQTQNLENAYNQNLSTLQQSKEQIAPTYFNQGNDLATQYERTRRNNNMRADMNGLNTGTASQMDLAQQSNYLSSYGQIRAAQANAERQADRQITDLEMGYKNSVAQALADNDYQRAAAMLSEYKRRDEAAKEEQRYQYQIQTAEQKYQDQLARQQEQDAFAREQYNNSLARQQEQDAFAREQYNNSLTRQQEQDAFARQQYNNSLTRQQAQDEFARQQYADQIARQQQQDAFSREQYNYQVEQARNQQALNEAKQRAAYGDFSGYAGLYGQDVANSMQQFWAMSNPDYAYSMGLITADQYEQMTGYSPDRSSLYSGYSSGGSSGGGGGSSYRGSSSSSGNNSNVSGPGVYDPNGQNNGEAPGNGNGADDATMEYINHLKMIDAFGGNESAAYAQELRNREMTAQAYAEQAAAAYGLKPGTTAYNTFMNEQKANILANDPTYAALRTAANANGEKQRAEELKEQSKAERQRVADFSDAMQGYDPVTGMSYADINAQAQQSKTDVKNAAGAVMNWLRGVTTPYQPAEKPATVISGNKTTTGSSGTSNGGTKRVGNTNNRST